MFNKKLIESHKIHFVCCVNTMVGWLWGWCDWTRV